MSLYYEIHMTIDHPGDDTDWDALRRRASYYGWRMGDLFMLKGGRNQRDVFFTTRSKVYEAAVEKTQEFASALMSSGFHVIRYKIEDTLMDSKMNDELGLLV